MGTPKVSTDQSLTQIKSLGSILPELIKTSDAPLYKGYRKFLASKEIVEKGGQDDE